MKSVGRIVWLTKHWWVAAGMLFLSTAGLMACPFCNTETGKQIYKDIFGDEFGSNVLLTLAPVPVVIGIVFLICWLIPDAPGGRKGGKVYERRGRDL